jgi:hypothetical protein
MADAPEILVSSSGGLESKAARSLLQATAVALFIVTGTMCVFIYRQATLVRRQTQELTQVIVQFERSGLQNGVEELRKNLFVFMADHPDFRPIYAKYFGTNQPGADAPKVAPAPAPDAK